MQEDELKILCSEWQKILGLAHWNIDTKIVRGVEINNNCGQNDYSFTDENSLIRIKDLNDYHGYFSYDMEAVLVHELLHLVLDENNNYEQSLTRLARILVKLKRGEKTY